MYTLPRRSTRPWLTRLTLRGHLGRRNDRPCERATPALRASRTVGSTVRTSSECYCIPSVADRTRATAARWSMTSGSDGDKCGLLRVLCLLMVTAERGLSTAVAAARRDDAPAMYSIVFQPRVAPLIGAGGDRHQPSPGLAIVGRRRRPGSASGRFRDVARWAQGSAGERMHQEG